MKTIAHSLFDVKFHTIGIGGQKLCVYNLQKISPLIAQNDWAYTIENKIIK